MHHSLLFASALLLVQPCAVAQSQNRAPKPPAATGWTITKNADPMSDTQTKTLLLSSAHRRASLRVNCNDKGQYVVLFTLPKGIPATNPTMVEFRFDTDPSQGYLIEALDLAPLVATFGGSKTDQNYIVGTATPGAHLEKLADRSGRGRAHRQDANGREADLPVAIDTGIRRWDRRKFCRAGVLTGQNGPPDGNAPISNRRGRRPGGR